MRWRMHKICFANDIVKIYRMVLPDKRDTDYHRLLWRCGDENKVTDVLPQIKGYRLKTVTFGTASAPYLVIKALMKLADDEGEQYPKAAKLFTKTFMSTIWHRVAIQLNRQFKSVNKL